MAESHRERWGGKMQDKGGAVFNMAHPDYDLSPTMTPAQASDAFAAAMDDAYAALASADPKGAEVVVPFHPNGYEHQGIVVPSWVKLVGKGGAVKLHNAADDGTPGILVDGNTESWGSTIRGVVLENLLLSGDGYDGHAIHAKGFQGLTCRNVRARGCGGSAFHGEHGSGLGAPFADDLTLEDFWGEECGAGVTSDNNAHAWNLKGSVLINNVGRNLDVSCDDFVMIGGEINHANGQPAARLWNCNGGGFAGTHFEQLANSEGSMLELGDVTLGAARGVALAFANATSFAGTAEGILVDFVLALNCAIRDGHYDASSDFDVTCFKIRAGCVGTVIDNPNFGANGGDGDLIPWDDLSGDLLVKQGRKIVVASSTELQEWERRNGSGGASVGRLVLLPSGSPNDFYLDIEDADGNVYFRNQANAEILGILGRAPTTHTGIRINGGPRFFSGTGSPEGVVVGTIGDTFIRTDGSTGTVWYVKESGTGNTGWAPK